MKARRWGWLDGALLALPLVLALVACGPVGAALEAALDPPRAPQADGAPCGPVRVAAAGGAAAELAVALGAGGRLVAVDQSARHPPELLERLPVVGYVRALPVEGLAALAPDLVLAAADAGPPQALDQLARLGIRVELLPAGHGLQATLARVRRAGALLGEVERAQALAARLEADARAIAERAAARALARGSAPRVLWVLHPGGGAPLVAGSGTAADAVLHLAAAANAGAEFDGWKPMGAEAVRTARPDWVLLGTGELGVGVLDARSAEALLPGLGGTPAFGAGRVLAVDQGLLLSGGPRLALGLGELVRRLHPGIDLADIDPWDPCAL